MKTRRVVTGDWDVIAKAFGLSAYEAHEAFPSLAVLVCPEGTRIVREGDPGVDVFIVAKGALAVRRSVLRVFSREVARLSPGDFFGEVGFLMERGRTATVTTLGPSEIYRILAEELQNQIKRRPSLRQRLEQAAQSRLQALRPGVPPDPGPS